MVFLLICVSDEEKHIPQPTGSPPSLRDAESLRFFVRGGATGEDGADFRRNGLRNIFTIL